MRNYWQRFWDMMFIVPEMSIAVAEAMIGKTASPSPGRPGKFSGEQSALEPETGAFRPDLEPELFSPSEGRKILEALRFGLAPKSGIEELTIGLGEIETRLGTRFNRVRAGHPCVYFVSGSYGSGKSHTLNSICLLAEQIGFVTARAELDGQQVSMADPERLLAVLWSKLHGLADETGSPLTSMYQRAFSRGVEPSSAWMEIDRLSNNWQVLEYLDQSGKLEDCSDIVESLLGSGDEYSQEQAAREMANLCKMPAMEIKIKPYRARIVKNRPRLFVESLATNAWLAQQAGYQGLVVAIDEFESEYNWNTEGKQRVSATLDALGEYVAGRTDIPFAPLAVFIAQANYDTLEKDMLVSTVMKNQHSGHLAPRGWTSAERQELASKIHQLYMMTYDLDIPFKPALASEIEWKLERDGLGGGQQIRSFIKCYLASLDERYGPSSGSSQRDSQYE